MGLTIFLVYQRRDGHKVSDDRPTAVNTILHLVLIYTIYTAPLKQQLTTRNLCDNTDSNAAPPNYIQIILASLPQGAPQLYLHDETSSLQF